MVPPTAPLNLNVEAISGICGSVSIACWVVVFSPQILENFRRGSADGLSLQFLIVWLLGDVFNILGAVLQGVLPTMVVLAIYYTIADVVLLCQCFYYRGFTLRDDVVPPKAKPPAAGAGTVVEEHSALLDHPQPPLRESDWSSRPSHLSPAVPLVSDVPPPSPPPRPATVLEATAFNILAILMVCAAGVGGWYLSRSYGAGEEKGGGGGDTVDLDLWGQIFGYLCAALYLGSRLPQLLLNWRRKSTEGVSLLFFLFACLGNITYVLSIVAYDPRCDGSECEPGHTRPDYGTYILVNFSWLVGSFGTLLLDLGIFVQFFVYSKDEGDGDEESNSGTDSGDEEAAHDHRPLLERNASNYSG